MPNPLATSNKAGLTGFASSRFKFVVKLDLATGPPAAYDPGMETYPERKLGSPDLVEFASASSGAGTRSVIVELASPPRAAPRSTEPHHPRPQAKGHAREAALVPDDDRAARLDRLGKELDTLGLDEPVRIDSAEAFVVDVTPDQLRALARCPLSGVIRPNRTHRVYSDS
jgi:hypothetical protein